MAVGLQAIILALTTFPTDLMETVRREIFRVVSFKRADNPTRMPLVGNEDMAFDGLEAVHVIEVLRGPSP